LQADFAELAVSGLASIYPAFDWSHLLRAIIDISVRAFSLSGRHSIGFRPAYRATLLHDR
jgi:hypothetical protein